MRSWTSWTAIEITEFCWRHLVNCEFREVSLTLCVYLLISLPWSLVSCVEYCLMWFKSFIGCRFTEARLLAVKNWICRQYLTAIFTFYVSNIENYGQWISLFPLFYKQCQNTSIVHWHIDQHSGLTVLLCKFHDIDVLWRYTYSKRYDKALYIYMRWSYVVYFGIGFLRIHSYSIVVIV